MGRPLAIPEKFHPTVLGWAGEGLGSRAIAERLAGKEYKVKVSHQAVARLMRNLREERKEIATAVTREKLADHVTSDLDAMASTARKLRRTFDALYSRMFDAKDEPTSALTERIGQTPMPVVLANVSAQLKSVLETKLKFAGAEEGQQAGGIVILPATREAGDEDE